MTLQLIEPAPDKNWKPPIKEEIRGVETRIADVAHAKPLNAWLKDGDTYLDFETDVPPDKDFLPFLDALGQPEIHVYWEPYNPGLEIQSYALVSSIASTVEGQWACRCKAEEDQVRTRLAQFGGDPDKFRLSKQDILDMADPEKVTACETCSFKTTSTTMWNYHKGWWKHQ